MLSIVSLLLGKIACPLSACVFFIIFEQCFAILIIAFDKNLSDKKAKQISRIACSNKIQLPNISSSSKSDK